MDPLQKKIEYEIATDFCGLLPDHEVKHHQYHYANGQKEFEDWLRDVVGHQGVIRLNFFLTLARQFVDNKGVLPESALYNLQRWLRGRQFCYCHHMHQGDADEGHLHPIHIARELIQLLRPMDSEHLVAECTPSNLSQMVREHGSPKAQAIYDGSLAHSPPSPPRSPSLELEEKRRRMSQQSWRRSSDSSSNEDRSRASSVSSSTSLSTLSSWRSRSTSPSNSSSTWASRVGQPTEKTSSTTPRPKKLVLKTHKSRASLNPLSDLHNRLYSNSRSLGIVL